jgi:sec-independent protein translocase protein TatA
MPGWISPWEIALVLLAALLLFGGKRLPEMGKQLGTGMREFKNSITGKDDEPVQTLDELPAPPPPAQQDPVVAPAREHDTV